MKIALQKAVYVIMAYGFMLVFSGMAKAQTTANFTADKLSGCSPLKVKFTDASTGTIIKRSWKLDASLTVADSLVVSTTYLAPGTYPVTLTVTDNNNVTTSKTIDIKVYALPKVNYTYSDSVGCINFDVKFNNLSTPGDGTIIKTTWVFGDGVSEETMATPVFHTYKTPGKGDVTLVVTNSYGCISSLAKVKMEALALPKLEIKSDLPVTSCKAPFKVTFHNSTLNNGPLTYKWKFGDGSPLLPSNSSEIVHEFKNEGSFQVFLIASNASCSDSVKLKDLIVIKKPKAGFTFTKDTVCQGTTITFNNTTDPSPVASTWLFGDGGTSTNTNPEHTYTTAGTFTVKLVAQVGDCKDSIDKKIVIIPSPVCTFASNGTYSCTKPFTTNFTNTSTGGDKYEWDFGDNSPTSTSTEKDPVHIYDTLGTHTVKLKVTNSQGCFCTITKNKYIAVNDPKITKLIITRDETPPLTFQHSAVITTIKEDSIVSYEWDFGDGTKSTEAKPKHTYAAEGNYTVTLTVKTKNGCPATIKITSSASGTGGGGADGGTSGATTVCSSIPIQFNDRSPKADKWKWYFGDGDSSETQNPLHKYNKTGTFTVTLKVWYQGSFMGVKVFTNYITINSGGISKFSYTRDCSKKNEIKFTNLSTGGDTYEWKFGDGNTSTVKDPTHIYAAKGAYKVTLIVRSNTSSCIDSSSVKLGILNEKPDFKTTDTAFCKLKIIRHIPINCDSSNIDTYYWNFGDGGTANSYRGYPSVTHAYNLSGVFDVRLVIKDTVGCFDTIVKKAFIKVGGPVANFTPSALIGCTPFAATFTDASTADSKSPIKQWIWDYGDGTKKDTLTAPPFKHTYSKTSGYTTRLTVIDTFGCFHYKDINIQSVKPKASFETADTAKCPGNSIQFYNTSYGSGLKYKWYFGDDSTSTASGTYVKHTYQKGNNYTVSLVVTDQYGCSDSFTLKTPIRIYQPKAAFGMSDSIYACPTALISFTNKSENALLNKWYFGDDNQSELKDPSNAYNRADTFKIKLVITSIGGCRDSATRRLIVKGPSGKFNSISKTGCAPVTINVTATAKNTVKYIWDFNDGSTTETTIPSASHTYKSAGTYKPKLILDDGAGCKITLTPDSVVTVDKVTADFSAKPVLLCDSGNVLITSKSTYYKKVTYLWDFGGGIRVGGTDTTPLVRYTQKGFYPIKLKVVSQNGCADSVMKNNYIKAVFLPPASIATLSQPCLRDTQKLTVLHQADTIPLKYRWYYSNLQTDTNRTIAFTYNKAGNHNITMVIKNRYGCTDTLKKTLIIDEATAGFKADKLILCDSGKVQFTNLSTFYTKLKYEWNLGNGITDTTLNPTATYGKAGFYSVTLKVTSAMGCKDAMIKTNFIAAPFLPATSLQALALPCLRDTQRFEAIHTSGTPAIDSIPINYNWDLGNGKSATKKLTALRYDTAGIYNIVLQIKNAYGCADTLHKIIIIDDATANFKADKLILCDSGKTQFTNLSTYYTKLRYQWNLGNGISDTTVNPAIVYNKPGFYSITLKVTSAMGCKDSVTKPNFIVAPFLPATTINAFAPPCLRDTQKFEAMHTATNAATDTIPVNYNWDLGNGKYMNKKQVALQYDSPGKYNIVLQLKNHYGCADTLHKAITIDDARANFKADKLVLCDSGKINFTNLSACYTQPKYEWWLNNTGNKDTSINPSVTYTKKGIYTVKLKVTSALGCTDSVTKANLIKVILLPKTTLLTSNAACLTGKIDFEANTSFDDPGLSYLWDFSNGNTATTKKHSEIYVKTGAYKVTLIIKLDSACTDTLIKTVNVYPNPVPIVTPKDTVICSAKPLLLLASGGTKYSWTPALDLSCDTCASTVATPTVNRTYIARVTNQYNCSSSDSVKIALKKSPKVTVNDGGDICIGESYQLRANGAEKIIWTPGATLSDSNSINPIATPPVTTIYYAIGSNKNGCDTDTGKIKVIVHPLPVINTEREITALNGDSVQLITTGSNDILTWDWQPNTGLSCNNCPSPYVYLTDFAKYTVTVTSRYGCVSGDYVRVKMLCEGNMVYIPNAFTPNGDGLNDIFYLKGKGIKTVRSLTIYNRWGSLIFERSNFNINDPSQGWDGTHNGARLQTDTFVYLIEMECENNQPVKLKGTVSLIK